ncbi:hypothetical protein PV327_008103 [Microctonus hyperodae]|uniref:THAP-type domain-containing protein n=1 Tax=Microctonus hyperodae TaxID=165561 RepID=A0AA39F2E3_MICHY|nr:hypothetical protein PV327_008103 [Microctonus hyperodae]
MEVGIFPKCKRSSNRLRCGVEHCNSKSNKDLHLTFHNFPKPGVRSVVVKKNLGTFEKVDKFQAWKNALKINKVHPRMKVCSLHFKKCDYILPDFDAKKRFLKKNAIPSCNLTKSLGVNISVKSESRLQRRSARDRVKISEKQNIKLEQPNIDVDESITVGSVSRSDDFDAEGIGNDPSEVNFDARTSTSSPGVNEIGVQVQTMFFTPTFMDLMTTENEFTAATGIQSYKILETIVGMVKLVFGETSSNCKMTLRERIIMTFVKLKQNLSYAFLALIFKKCTAVQCQRIFLTTLVMLSKCLKFAIPWPSKEEISRNLPQCFEGFEDTRVVINCTEINIQAPNKRCCQELTSSNYKSSATCKIMIGVTPAGLISYCSKAYGGRHSETVIFEQSDLIKLLEPGDAIMTDRQFLIEELCARNNWKLIRPPFIEDKKLEKNEAILMSKIAKARVHVERINQRIKDFEILGGTMSEQLIPVIDEIFTVVCGTVNLSTPIIKDDEFMKK